MIIFSVQIISSKINYLGKGCVLEICPEKGLSLFLCRDTAYLDDIRSSNI